MWFFFFFSSRRRHTRLVSDWSSDVCSSDLKICREDILRHAYALARDNAGAAGVDGMTFAQILRSEERRVGKECRDGGMQYRQHKQGENRAEDDSYRRQMQETHRNTSQLVT